MLLKTNSARVLLKICPENVILLIVPPNSMTQTSAGPSFPSTGTSATRSIQSWMASVMCGTTYQYSKGETKTKKKSTIDHNK